MNNWAFALFLIVFAGASLIAQDHESVKSLIVAPPETTLESGPAVTWLLAIGVEKYENVSSLSYTADDAAAFARAFREVGRLSPARLHLIAPGHSEARRLNADSATIKEAILRVSSFAKPADTFVFYFSGHGFRSDDEMYLATADIDLADPAKTSLSVGFVRETLSKCRAKNQLIFLDACHSGAFNAGNVVDGRDLANRLAQKAGVTVMTSSTGGEVSVESSNLKHGVFTYRLVQGLRGRANLTVDAKIDVQELYRFVRKHVPDDAKQINRTMQTPAFAAQNLTDVPTVLGLHNPDRPSVLIAAKNDVPVGNIGYDPSLIEAMANFAAADPVLVIGRLKWITENNQPNLGAQRAAEQALLRIDRQILDGQIVLPDSVTGN